MSVLYIHICIYLALPFSQAVANESGLNFISVKGPELLNMVRANHEAFVIHGILVQNIGQAKFLIIAQLVLVQLKLPCLTSP